MKSAAKIAQSVKRMSDFYIENPNSETPWGETWCQEAQLNYYYPLNAARSLAVFRECNQNHFFDGIRSIVDFGSGLSPITHSAHEIGIGAPLFLYEKSTLVRNLAEQLHSQKLNWLDRFHIKEPKSTLVTFSYSFTEIKDLPEECLLAEALLFIEPSTQMNGRKLLHLRQRLIESGYHVYAPCLHQQSCPLLTQSPHDWCHDRIHIDRPRWMLEIESHLPFSNPTLTFSYLACRKSPPRTSGSGATRVVGDQLREKGKTRQMICRGPNREFLSMLSRHGEGKELRRGDLIQFDADSVSQKQNEIRYDANDKIEVIREHQKSFGLLSPPGY